MWHCPLPQRLLSAEVRRLAAQCAARHCGLKPAQRNNVYKLPHAAVPAQHRHRRPPRWRHGADARCARGDRHGCASLSSRPTLFAGRCDAVVGEKATVTGGRRLSEIARKRSLSHLTRTICTRNLTRTICMPESPSHRSSKTVCQDRGVAKRAVNI